MSFSWIWTTNHRGYNESIDASPIEKVEVRSPLVWSVKSICAKCYGRNLATGKWHKEVKQ
jgi:hypothetical protein